MGRRQAPIGWHLPEFRPLARPLARAVRRFLETLTGGLRC
jgi:hypothetical protein